MVANLEKNRPRGVTIVAILMIISGILFIIGGLSIVSFTLLISGSGMGGLAAMLYGLSGFVIALGIASIVVAWGLLSAKGWAWIVTVILAIISIIASIVSIASGGFFQVIPLIIYGVILYYMYRPEVKSYFGRVKISR